MVAGNFRILFEGIATSAATLTGLLFVAMSVAKTRATSHSPVIREFRAAAALLAFTNPLSVSLFGLVPGTNIGYPATVVGVIGILFTGAGIRTTFSLPELRPQRRAQMFLILLLLTNFGFELVYGIDLISGPHRTGALTAIGYVLVASLLMGIARSWELVGDWDTGLVSSVALLIGLRSMKPSVIVAPVSDGQICPLSPMCPTAPMMATSPGPRSNDRRSVGSRVGRTPRPAGALRARRSLPSHRPAAPCRQGEADGIDSGVGLLV